MQSDTTVPSSSQPIILETPEPPPSYKSKPLLFIALGIGLVVLFGAFAGGFWFFTKGQNEVRAIVQAQNQQFQNLENTYDDARDILNKIPTIQGNKTKELLDSSKTKSVPSRYDNVLGVEEELGIDQNRKLAEEYKVAIKQVDSLKKNNRKLEELAKSNPFVSLLVPQNADLIKDTDKFADNSSALLAYLQKVNSFEINSTMVGYQIGLAIREALLRSGDDVSVSNLEGKINEIDKLYVEFKRIDITDIPDELQNSHAEDLASFDKDVGIFNEILSSFKTKNGALLQKTLQSIIIQGQGASNESEVKFKSFWQENTILNAVGDLSDRWTEYGKLIGVAE